jgi:predicted transposase YdaD
MRHNKTKDIREVIMNLMPVYEKWEAEKIAEGEHRGEQSKGIAIARRMLTRGIPIAEIAELTELTMLQIEAIQEEDSQK